MSVRILSIGDVVKYPSRYDSFDRTMPVLDRWYKRYPSGKRFVRYNYGSRLAECMISEMRCNVDNHYDNIVGVGGKEGIGKSSLCYYLAKLYDPDFNMEKGYIYDAQRFVEAINSGDDRGKVFWLDEATNIASNRDWMKEENKLFIQILEMARSRNWTLLLCIPDLKRLDVYLRNFRLRYTIEVLELGWENDPAITRGYYRLKKAPDFISGPHKDVGYGTFPPMPSEIEDLYKTEFKDKAQERKFMEIGEAFDNKKSGNSRNELAKKNRKLVLELYERGVSYSELQKITGYEYSTLRSMICNAKKDETE